jgi:hypothetical protein
MKVLLRPCVLGCIFQFIILSTTAAANAATTHHHSVSRSKSACIKKPVATANTDLKYLRLQLVKDVVNKDEILIVFDSTASARYNPYEDAKYLMGFGQEHLFSYSADSIPLAINALPFPKQHQDLIRLNVSAKASGAFQLNMNQIANIPKMYDIWLIDKYKTDSLDMRQNNIYNFNIDLQDTASYGGNRFTLIIREAPAYVYQLMSFTATAVPGATQVQLAWATANEENSTLFTVERSNNNGASFKALCEIKSAGLGVYANTDETPALQNMYRLKQQDPNNNITYSNPITVSFTNQNSAGNSLSIYPNPVSDMINLSVGSSGATAPATYSIKFVNSAGLVIKEITSSEPSWEGDISGLRPGVYFAQVLNNKTDTVIGRKRFVKY